MDIKPYKEKRFAIFSEGGKCLDNAQGYGYKTRQAAHKAAAYRYKGGRKKAKQDRSRAQLLARQFQAEHGCDLWARLQDFYLTWIKELSREEVAEGDFWDQIKKEFSVTIEPKDRRLIQKHLGD